LCNTRHDTLTETNNLNSKSESSLHEGYLRFKCPKHLSEISCNHAEAIIQTDDRNVTFVGLTLKRLAVFDVQLVTCWTITK